MEKIDLVYILGTGSRWRNNEIRYSLRSVERNFPVGKVFIIGECPDWITGAIHIPAPDIHKNKQANAREKYLIAAKDKRIGENFALMNDDFFILKSVKKVENYSRGTIQEMIDRHPTKSGYYYQSLKDTKRVLESMGIVDPEDFEIHAPIMFNKEKLLTTIQLVGAEKDYSFRSCYGNLNALKGKKTIDFKANGLVEFAYQVKRDPTYLSISDALVAEREFRDWLRRKFRNPSRYETDRGEGADILPGGEMKSLRYYAVDTFTYAGKTYSQGEIIQHEIMDELRNQRQMKDLWVLK
ncbi:MAG: hypothetical protein WA082_04350 [Candidatus Moraniibacteriota bacterium]